MSPRLERFVSDLVRAIDFYRDSIGITLLRHDAGNASLRHGSLTLGLGLGGGRVPDAAKPPGQVPWRSRFLPNRR